MRYDTGWEIDMLASHFSRTISSDHHRQSPQEIPASITTESQVELCRKARNVLEVCRSY